MKPGSKCSITAGSSTIDLVQFLQWRLLLIVLPQVSELLCMNTVKTHRMQRFHTISLVCIDGLNFCKVFHLQLPREPPTCTRYERSSAPQPPVRNPLGRGAQCKTCAAQPRIGQIEKKKSLPLLPCASQVISTQWTQISLEKLTLRTEIEHGDS